MKHRSEKSPNTECYAAVMRTKKSHSEPSPTRLQLLIDEYKSARDDERAESALLLTILGTVLASALAAALFFTQSKDSALQVLVTLPTQSSSEAAQVTASIPQPSGETQPLFGATFWISILAPIVLLLPVAYAATLGGTRAIRSFYIRALEREIRSELDSAIPTTARGKPTVDICSYPGLRLFTLKELELASTDTGRVNGGSTLLVFTATCFIATFMFLGTQAYYRLLKVNDLLAAFAAILYGAVALIVAHKTVQNSLRGRDYFKETVELTERSADSSLLPKSSFKSNSPDAMHVKGSSAPDSLNLFTKPDDLVKTLHNAIGAFTAYSLISFHTSNRVHDGHLLMLILMILAFEMLVYQTRYLVNDVLGRNEEGVLKSRGQRGKMTGSPEHVLAAVRSLMLRGALILVSVVLALFSGVGLTFTIGIALLALLTGVYEAVRRAEAKTAHNPRVQGVLARLVFILVSLGIPLRFVFGFAVYSELYFGSLREALQWMAGGGWAFAPLVLWYFCFSLTTVAPTWALEGLFEARFFDKGALQFQWKAEGKRHVWISLGCFLRPLGIAPGDFPCPLSNSLGDRELSGHECWTAISNQSAPLLQRLRGWMVVPWVISATGGVVAAHLFLSSLYNAPTPPLIILISALAHFLLSAVAMDCIATRGSGLLGALLTVACALVPTSLALTTNARLVGSTWIWLIAPVLFFSGGPVWFQALRGKYSDTRNILAKTLHGWAHLDIQITNKLLGRLH